MPDHPDGAADLRPVLFDAVVHFRHGRNALDRLDDCMNDDFLVAAVFVRPFLGATISIVAQPPLVSAILVKVTYIRILHIPGICR